MSAAEAMHAARGLLLDPAVCAESDPGLGGKGRSLLRLARSGLPVPRFHCVSAQAHARLVECAGAALDAELAGLDYADAAAVDSAARRARERILGCALPPDLEALLGAVLPAALRHDRVYAVRSSAIGEDSAAASFAGQLETYLAVPGPEVADRVRRCWASAYAARVLHYLRAMGGDPLETRVAVVIQELVDSAASGVLFTLDPSGRREAAVLVAGLGLGEGVVSDRVETDTFVLDRGTGALERELRTKTSRVVRDGAEGGTALAPVPEALRDAPAIDASQARELFQIGLRLERERGAPHDLEWAVDAAGAVHLLQARPITALAAGARCIFDNSNIVESYPGITSPLTFSFIRGVYETIFRGALRRMGVRERALARHAHVFRNLVGYVEGRVYYALSSWYPMLRLLPAADWLVPAWEEAAGVSERAAGSTPPRRGARALLAGAGVAARVGAEWLRLDRSMRALKRDFAARRTAFFELDLASLDDRELARLVEDITAELLDGWEITILNDFLAIGFSSLSRRLLERAVGPEAGDVWNDLLCGDPGMESVEPVRSLVGLGELARARPGLAKALGELADGDAPVDAELDRWADDPERAEFCSRFRGHLERYGDRCFEELKLESRTYRTDPRALVRMVVRHAEAGLSVEAMERRERSIRAAAEARVARASRRHPARRALLRFALAQARRSIRHREASRLDRARAFAIPRAIFRQLGRNLARSGALAAPDDVFFLTEDELLGYVRGAAVEPDLAGIAARRRAQAAAYATRRPAARIECRGSVYGGRIPQRAPAGTGAGEPGGDGTALEGVPCAPGAVTAQALVVRDPERAGDVAGRILVAEMTDPGWVFLMTSAAGLVVEKGSILSHTAIIGRELGVPTVVGVAGATERIRDGARVRLDGSLGTVVVLPES